MFTRRTERAAEFSAVAELSAGLPVSVAMSSEYRPDGSLSPEETRGLAGAIVISS